MSKIFGTLTLIALALSAFIGLKNRNATIAEIDNRAKAQEELTKTEARLEKAAKNRDQTRAEHEAVKAEVPKVEAQRDDQQKANDEITKAKEAKAAEIETNKGALEQARERIGTLDNIKDLASKMSSMSNELKEIEDKVGADEGRLASLTAENTRVERQVAEQRQQIELRSKGESFPDLNTRINAVYPNWGFVTLAAGNNAGVITNSTLDVVRNGEVIAKLLVTAVERNSASASIIPDTVKADATVSVGDRVVPGAKYERKAANTSPVTGPGN